MSSDKTKPENIDEYIAGFPDDVQEILEKVRATIKKAAPKAEEAISYQIPTFKMNGTYLIYFAAYKNHLSIYPAPVGNPEFEKEMALYGSGKGTAQFSYTRPIPFDLITRMVKFLMKENQARAQAKEKKK